MLRTSAMMELVFIHHKDVMAELIAQMARMKRDVVSFVLNLFQYTNNCIKNSMSLNLHFHTKLCTAFEFSIHDINSPFLHNLKRDCSEIT